MELTITSYSFRINNAPIVPGSVLINDTGSPVHETFTDDGHGHLVGDGSPAGTGSLDYHTGFVTVVYGRVPTSEQPNLQVSYSYYSANTEEFTDSPNQPGILTGSGGGTGTINYSTGNFSVQFHTAPVESGPLVGDYKYKTPSDGVLQLASIWPGDGGNDLSFLVSDGSDYLDEEGKRVLPVSKGGTSFRIQVYDQGQRTNIEFDNLSMIPSSKNIHGQSRYVEDVLGTLRFGEYGFKDDQTNDYVIARVMKAPTPVRSEEVGVNTDAGIQTYSFSLANTPIIPGTVRLFPINNLPEVFVDDADAPGVLVGTGITPGEGAINYETGVVEITFGVLPTTSADILADYEYSTVDNPFVGTNGFMFYLDPTRFNVKPAYDYVRIKGQDAISDLTDGDIIGDFDRQTNTRTGIYAFMDPEQLDINLLAAPGFSAAAVAAALINVAEYRSDALALIDPPMGLSVQEVVDWHNGALAAGVTSDNTPGDFVGYTTAALNSSYAAMWYPWGKLYDPRNNQYVWVPPSVGAVKAIAKTDNVADVGKAPAGYNRGDLKSWLDLEYSPNQGERDYLYGNQNAINPIVKRPKQGIVILGERTLYRLPTKLDRIHVRRMLLYIRKVIATAAVPLLFEPHDRQTWLRFKLLVIPYLDFEIQRRNLYRYEVVCDESTNTSYMIDTSTMVGNIYLWPESAVERLIINFVVSPTSISFDEAYEIVQGQASGGSAAENYLKRLGSTA